MANTPSPLYHAVREAEAVEGFSKALGLVLKSPQRTKKAVQEAMEACEIFHFARHGFTDPAEPLRSQIILEDWKTDPLTVQSLMDINIHHRMPSLAYLSACGTGENHKKESADENIDLSSGCQLAGFWHVIGTMWRVDNEVCVKVAQAFYATLSKGKLLDESVCYALHKATRQQRDEWVRCVRPDSPEAGYKQEVARAARDAELVRKPELERLSWVPYVHYGI